MSKRHAQGNTPDNPKNVKQSVIARKLTGVLYCVSCGYDLNGLSIRSNCPECGVPVRATILGIVDPKADELTPLTFPRVSAVGLNMWSFGALVAVLMVWILRGAELLQDFGAGTWRPGIFAWLGLSCLAVSLLGAMTMIRPHAKVARLTAIRCALGVSCYIPLIWVYDAIYLGGGLFDSAPLLSPGGESLGRTIMRVLMFLLVAGIVFGLRPAAVALAIRSIIVRTGRVDRQSMVTVLASLGIASIGDLLAIGATFTPIAVREVLDIVSIVIISLGSVLFTVGLVNICVDTIRLYPVLVRPGVGLSDIFETNQQKSDRTQGI